MKILSILLRLVAIAGAAFAVYTWVDTKGKTSESMEHMKDVAGDTLQAKTAKVPSILKDLEKTKSDLSKTTNTLKETEATLEKTEGELRVAGDIITENQREIGEKNIKIKELNSNVSTLEATVAKNDSEISNLEAEIVKIKSETEPLIADLKAQIGDLEASVANKDAEIAEAVAAAEEAILAQVDVQNGEIYVDPVTGEKKLKAPAYIPEGEVATILKSNDENTMFVINKGTSAGFNLDDKIELKAEGKFIAEVVLVATDENMSVCAVANGKVGIPESILVGDLYEMNVIVPEVVEEDEEESSEI